MNKIIKRILSAIEHFTLINVNAINILSDNDISIFVSKQAIENHIRGKYKIEDLCNPECKHNYDIEINFNNGKIDKRYWLNCKSIFKYVLKVNAPFYSNTIQIEYYDIDFGYCTTKLLMMGLTTFKNFNIFKRDLENVDFLHIYFDDFYEIKVINGILCYNNIIIDIVSKIIGISIYASNNPFRLKAFLFHNNKTFDSYEECIEHEFHDEYIIDIGFNAQFYNVFDHLCKFEFPKNANKF
jgi:hypothetical protein